ncbi:SAP18-domain-containing protein [Backusella circina FSU 941]|nr:SAP18-domain-containing protein [Backusella circina FSU 941]
MSATIDREKECPFLLRVFTRNGGHNPQNATLEEIAQLIQQVIPEARHEDARIAFRLVYLDSARARFSYRELGRVVTSKPTEEHQKTLDECKLLIGDYLDVAIYIGPPPAPLHLRSGNNNNNQRPGNGRFGGGNRSGRGFGRDNRDNNNRFGGGGRQQRRDRF